MLPIPTENLKQTYLLARPSAEKAYPIKHIQKMITLKTKAGIASIWTWCATARSSCTNRAQASSRSHSLTNKQKKMITKMIHSTISLGVKRGTAQVQINISITFQTRINVPKILKQTVTILNIDCQGRASTLKVKALTRLTTWTMLKNMKFNGHLQPQTQYWCMHLSAQKLLQIWTPTKPITNVFRWRP